MIRHLTTILGTAILAVSCSRGVSRVPTCPLPSPNPTAYSFPLPLEEVRMRALQAFDEHQYEEPIFGRPASAAHFESFLPAECSTNSVFAVAVFRDPANTNDIYLHSFHTPFVISSVYRGRNGGLPFIATFHLHLTTSGSNTLVTVTANDAEVVNGEKFGSGPCGLGYGWHYDKVKPTTIEEYSMLRYLGRYLSVTELPEVIFPRQ